VIVLAGANGAGKSTVAPALLQGALRVGEFVNADVIAHGLSAFAPESVALSAGKIMLKRLKELAAARASFAFETTLASRTFAPWISQVESERVRVSSCFFVAGKRGCCGTAGAGAGARSYGRSRRSEETIRRRYEGGLHNLVHLYMPLATTWQIYDNAIAGQPKLLAEKLASGKIHVVQKDKWRLIKRGGRT
jgi:predicted ABC-type ATPase